MGGTYASLIFTYELLASFKFEISCPRIACKSIPKAHLYLQWISCLPDCYEQESVRHVTSHATLSLSLATNKPRFSNHWSAGASWHRCRNTLLYIPTSWSTPCDGCHSYAFTVAFISRPDPTSIYQLHNVVVGKMTPEIVHAAVDWQTFTRIKYYYWCAKSNTKCWTSAYKTILFIY